MAAATGITAEAEMARPVMVSTRTLLAGGFGLAGYLAAAIWWGASLEGRVVRLEQELSANVRTREKIWRRIEELDKGLARVDRRTGEMDERTRAIRLQVDRIYQLVLAKSARSEDGGPR